MVPVVSFVFIEWISDLKKASKDTCGGNAAVATTGPCQYLRRHHRSDAHTQRQRPHSYRYGSTRRGCFDYPFVHSPAARFGRRWNPTAASSTTWRNEKMSADRLYVLDGDVFVRIDGRGELQRFNP